MKQVKVQDWEEGKVNLPDDVYEPITEFHPLLGPKVVGFKGRASGIVLEPAFRDVLEVEDEKK